MSALRKISLITIATLLISATAYAGEISGSIEAGYNSVSGNSNSETISGELNLECKDDIANYSAESGLLITKDDGDTSSEYIWASLQRNQELSILQGLYWYSLGKFETDRFALYKRYQANSGVGYGYEKNFLTISPELGIGIQRTDNLKSANTTDGIIRAYCDIKYQLLGNVTIGEEIEYNCDMANRNDYRVTSESSLNVGLLEGLSLKTSYLIRYENHPADAERTDRTWISRIRYSF